MQPPSRLGAWYTLGNGLQPNTYRAIRRGRDRIPQTEITVWLLLLRPGDTRVGRRPDGASIHHGGKFLCNTAWVVVKDASDRASHGDASPDMHTRRDHHREQGHGTPCEMACFQTRTVPSDEDAIEYHRRKSLSGCCCSVQVTPVSVDVQMEPPFTTAASFCAIRHG